MEFFNPDHISQDAEKVLPTLCSLERHHQLKGSGAVIKNSVLHCGRQHMQGRGDLKVILYHYLTDFQTAYSISKLYSIYEI